MESQAMVQLLDSKVWTGPAMTAARPGSTKLEDLLGQIAATRDHAAFAELYSVTKGKLFSAVLRIVRRRDIAEEIIQDAYVRIWRNADSYRSSCGSPMTWMITISRNLAIDVVRRPAREMYSDETVLLALPSECPTAVEAIEAVEDHLTAIEQQRNVYCALQALDPARRDLVIAAYIHGESRQQLSRRTGVPVNTVKTWIRRALLEVEANLRNMERRKAVVSTKASGAAGCGIATLEVGGLGRGPRIRSSAPQVIQGHPLKRSG